METLSDWLELLKATDIQLLKLGKTRLTLWGLLWWTRLIALLFFFSGLAQRWIAKRLLARTHLDIGTRESIAAIVRYLVLLIGLLIIMQTAGINLTTFNVLPGSVRCRLRFGLQTIMAYLRGIQD